MVLQMSEKMLGQFSLEFMNHTQISLEYNNHKDCMVYYEWESIKAPLYELSCVY